MKTPNKSKPTTSKILITGDPGTGKSTTAKAIGDKLGIPVFHSDTLVFKNAITFFPDSYTDENVNKIISESCSYIVEGADFGNGTSFDNLLKDVDLVLDFDASPEFSMASFLKRVDECKKGEMSHDGFSFDPTYDGSVRQFKFWLEWYRRYLEKKDEYKKKLAKVKKVKVISNFEEADKIIIELVALHGN